MKPTRQKILSLLLAFVSAVLARGAATPTPDFARLRAQVAALGELTRPPAVHPAEGFATAGAMKPLFFEGRPYKGRPTRVHGIHRRAPYP